MFGNSSWRSPFKADYLDFGDALTTDDSVGVCPEKIASANWAAIFVAVKIHLEAHISWISNLGIRIRRPVLQFLALK
jgi:hypothetical protein